MNLLPILIGAAAVTAPLLLWPRAAAHLLIATADAFAAFRNSWKRGAPNSRELPRLTNNAVAKARPGKNQGRALPITLDAVQIDTVSALKNYGMAKPDAEALVRMAGTASDVPALLVRALESRGRRAAA